MHHLAKAKLKQQSHIGVGYKTNPIVTNDHESYFYSEFDGIFRKHVFRGDDAFIQLVTSHEYLVATTPEHKAPEPVVEVVAAPEITTALPAIEVIEPVATKVEVKKKSGRKKKNVE